MGWRIGEILLQKKLISWEQLSDVLDEQKNTKEFTGEILVRKGYTSPLFVYKALAEQYSMRYVDLKRTRINAKAVTMLTKAYCEQHLLVPIELVGGQELVVGIANPLHPWPELEIKQLTRLENVRAVLCMPEDIREVIREHYTPPAKLQSAS